MKNLMQLFAANQNAPRNFRVENKAADEATIYIYDVIGGWFGGVNAQDFVKELNSITASIINVRINSPGGDVFEGRAIATALAQHSAKIIAHIDGIAASSASWIALKADEVVIADGAFLMIHNSWSLAMGDKNTMTDTAKLLDQIDQTFVKDYQQRTGKTAQEISDWMNAETWFEAQDAVDNGFADRIAESKTAASNQWDFTAYNNAPKALTEKPNIDEIIQPDRAAMERRLNLLAISSP